MDLNLMHVRFKVFLISSFIFAAHIHSTSGKELQKITVLHTNEIGNEQSKNAIDAVRKYLVENPSTRLSTEVLTVEGDKADLKMFLENMCAVYTKAVEDGQPPHIVFDTTKNVAVSETVKAFSSALALPTVSTSFGRQGDSNEWRDLSDEKQQYLLQVNPPLDTIPELVRAFVKHQNISNAAILFDDHFVMDYKFKTMLQNLPTRHVITAIAKSNERTKQMKKLRNLDINNFFILGSIQSIKNVLEAAKDEYFERNFAWYTITYDKRNLVWNSKNATIIFIQPSADLRTNNQKKSMEKDKYLDKETEIITGFYFDVALRTILAVEQMLATKAWPEDLQYLTCDAYNGTNTPTRSIDLKSYFINVSGSSPRTISFSRRDQTFNGNTFMMLEMDVSVLSMMNGKVKKTKKIGTWTTGLDSNLHLTSEKEMSRLRAADVYRVAVVVQPPFVMYDNSSKSGFKGYCIDLLDGLAESLGFEYEMKEFKDFGEMDEMGNWNGVMKALIDKDIDIALGTMAVMAERETFIDFTVPFYDLVGITILMILTRIPSSLFKFLTVLETDVWLCIVGAYFFTSLLMYVFDRYSPYSYQNNREKYVDDDEKREFDLKECFWFCMTSLTPQGGGEAPKNLSGRLVAATWWLFGFIIIASYTANLAAFLTVSRLDTPIESLEDLAKQYKVLYATLDGSPAMTYFQRMSQIEGRFYEIWKDMSLNDSLSPLERSKLAVWDYPVSDKYTKIWQAMQEAGLPKTLDEAVERIRTTSSTTGFAFIGDATDIKYLEMTNCDLQVVGEEFSRKPYAIGVQQGSPLKAAFDNTILRLLNDRFLEKLKEKWWRKQIECEEIEDQADGISIQNIGGVFIVIFIGIGLACVTLIFEYWYYRYRKPTTKIEIIAESTEDRSEESKLILPGALFNKSMKENPMLRSRVASNTTASKMKY